MTLRELDQIWMQRALLEAEKAYAAGEVPVGAVLVDVDQAYIASGYNASIQTQDPSAHAEIQTLRAAGQRLANYRYPGTTLYCNLEPCMMCLGALLHARVARIVFGAYDEKKGLCCVQQSLGPHYYERFKGLQIQGGILKEQSIALLRSFFQARR